MIFVLKKNNGNFSLYLKRTSNKNVVMAAAWQVSFCSSFDLDWCCPVWRSLRKYIQRYYGISIYAFLISPHVANLHNTKTSISPIRKRYFQKRTPLNSTLKSLSNKLKKLFMSYALHVTILDKGSKCHTFVANSLTYNWKWGKNI